MNIKKISIVFVFVHLFTSCTAHLSQDINKVSHSSKGFAYIYDSSNELERKKFKISNSNLFLAGHNKLKKGSIVRIANPDNNKFINIKISKKVKYSDFYKILISKQLALNLDLNQGAPFVEVTNIKKNKTFLAKKAKIFNEEKQISNKAPVQLVKIDNLSKNLKVVKSKPKNFKISIVGFYSLDSANLLKSRLIKELDNYDTKNIRIQSNNIKNYELFSGPYGSINSLKNDYIKLKQFGFEDLDIKIHE